MCLPGFVQVFLNYNIKGIKNNLLHALVVSLQVIKLVFFEILISLNKVI